MKLRTLLAVTCLVALAAGPADAQRSRRSKTIRIGIVVDGAWERNAEVLDIIRSEVLSLTSGEFSVKFPESAHRTADWTVAGVQDHVDALLADPAVDIIYGMGVIASQILGQKASLRKPVIAAFVIDSVVQGLPLEKGASGRKNLSYLTNPWTLDRDLQAFVEIAGGAKRLVMLGNGPFFGAMPQLRKRLEDAAARQDIALNIVLVGDSADEALAAIPADTQAVLIAPLIHLPSSELDELIAGVNARKLPSFSIVGRTDVERGVLASIRPAVEFNRIARRIALYTQRIALGEDAGTLPVTLQIGEQLVINMATARAIGHYPSWAVLTEADLVSAARDHAARKLTLSGAVRQAQIANQDLAASRQDVAAGRQDIRRARSSLLPQLSVTTSARVIDEPTADSSFGAAPRFLWDAEAAVSQVLWSERAWAGLGVERALQRSRDSGLQADSLDVAFDAAAAYLNILRAKSVERIRRDNLKVTRSNLDLSRIRVRIGTGNPAEVFRWDSQIANDRKAVIQASAARNIAEIALNQLLHRPTEDPFETAEAAIDDPALLTSHDKLFTYFADPGTLKRFRRFLIARAVERSPELAQLRAAVSAQERVVDSNRRALFSPTVALRGGLTADIVKAGAGSDGPDLPLPPGTELASAPDYGWFVGVSASLPLFTSGQRSADLQKSKIELKRYGHQHEAVRGKIEQRMASALHAAGASFAAIKLSLDSTEAARKNLELVTDAYAKGTVSVLQLLDAQNAAVVADELAANAVFDFLVDWMNVQRASGEFDLMMTPQQRREFFADADKSMTRSR